MSVVIDNNWFIVESPGLNPDWFLDRRLFVWKKLYIESNINFSKIYPQTGSREMGL